MSRSHRVSALGEVGGAFLKLGLTSFGGPVAHLGYLHEEIVRRRGWVEETDYADLVALCQFLPGPASSQLVFALGMRRAGLAGALVASLCFTLPSAVLMILFAYGVAALGDLRSAGWLHGLKLAAVAVVAQAVWSLGRKLCPDPARILLAVASAAWVLRMSGGLAQVGAIACGGLAGWWLYRCEVADGPLPEGKLGRSHSWALATLVTFGALLVLLPGVGAVTGLKPLAVFDSFYRAGALVFGGGHVVLPLLRAEVVPPGWVSDDAFLAGYGAAQAVPGPLFTFAAYLGAVIFGGSQAWLGGVWCLLGVFLPAWLVIGGALPFWQLLRSKATMQAALRGTNAAVVGLLLAALYRPVWTQGVTGWADVVIVLGALALLELRRAPPWLVVALAAAVGQWVLPMIRLAKW